MNDLNVISSLKLLPTGFQTLKTAILRDIESALLASTKQRHGFSIT